MKKKLLILLCISSFLVQSTIIAMETTEIDTQKKQSTTFRDELKEKLEQRRLKMEELIHTLEQLINNTENTAELTSVDKETTSNVPSIIPPTLMESFISPPQANNDDLGVLFTLRKKWHYARDIIHVDLTNGTFNPHSQEYRTLLNEALEDCMNYNDHTKLTEILTLIEEKYNKQIMPNDEVCKKVHTFLSSQIENDRKSLHNGSIDLNQLHVTRFTQILTPLLAAYETAFEDITKLHTQNTESKAKLLEQFGNNIKKNKQALLALHTLNRGFIPAPEDKCDDYIIKNGLKIRKKITTIQDLTDQQILESANTIELNKETKLTISKKTFELRKQLNTVKNLMSESQK